jgi:hypothetical protein
MSLSKLNVYVKNTINDIILVQIDDSKTISDLRTLIIEQNPKIGNSKLNKNTLLSSTFVIMNNITGNYDVLEDEKTLQSNGIKDNTVIDMVQPIRYEEFVYDDMVEISKLINDRKNEELFEFLNQRPYITVLNFNKECINITSIPNSSEYPIIEIHYDALRDVLSELVKSENNSTILFLELANHKLGDDFIKVLAEGLMHNHTLFLIDLSGNEITDDGVSVLIENLKDYEYKDYENMVLKKLILSNNEINITALSKITKELVYLLEETENFTEIFILDIKGNIISSQTKEILSTYNTNKHRCFF